MNKLKSMIFILCCQPFYLWAQVSLPPINLGATSFLDGKAGPGTLVEETLSGYSANKVVDNRGNSLPGDNEVEAVASAILVAHISETELLGGYYGVQVLVPFVTLDVDIQNSNEKSGVGDLIVSPFIIQWVDKTLFGIPSSYRLNFVFSLPTGSYDSDDRVNIGSNALSFNPYFAITLNPTPEFETSFRFHYLWNQENDSPNLSDDIKDTQAGQAFHFNYAASYQLNNNFRLGFSGYYLKQTSDHKINGDKLRGSKEQAFAIGPGIFYQDKKFSVIFNAYLESNVENRTEGNRYILKIAKVF